MRKFIIQPVAAAALTLPLLLPALFMPAEAATVRQCNNRHAACHGRCIKVFETPARREACGDRCVTAYLKCMNRGSSKGTGKAEQPPFGPKGGDRVPPRGGTATDPKPPPRGPGAGTRAPLSGTVQQPPKSAPSGTILKGDGRR